MHLTTRKLITVVAESALERSLISDLKQTGASGYTVTEVRGGGAFGVRDADWDQNCNIRLECICDEAVAEKILDLLVKKYQPNYAIVLFVSDVSVIRAQKFTHS